jgi:hypothetical protein
VEASLDELGLDIVDTQHLLKKAEHQQMGLLHVADNHGEDEYRTVIGVRNSNDQSYLAGLV